MFGHVRGEADVDRRIPERQSQPGSAHRPADGQAGSVHFRRIGFDWDVAGTGSLEHFREVAGSAADIEDGEAVERVTGVTFMQVGDQFDGIASERAVKMSGAVCS